MVGAEVGWKMKKLVQTLMGVLWLEGLWGGVWMLWKPENLEREMTAGLVNAKRSSSELSAQDSLYLLGEEERLDRYWQNVWYPNPFMVEGGQPS